MDIAKSILAKIEKHLSDGRDKPFQVSQVAAQKTVEIDAADGDKFSAVVSRVSIRSAIGDGGPRTELSQRASSLARKLDYLSSEFEVIEVDEVRGVAQLRTAIGEASAPQRHYFELAVSVDGSVTLSRYIYDTGTKSRATATFVLTHDLFERLISDLLDA